MPTAISALDALNSLIAEGPGLVDVRAEVEFAKAHIPGFLNRPILTDSERHQVGLCYKQKGQDAAIELGHQLVDPSRTKRVASWAACRPPHKDLLVTCWRGGLRSQKATEWLREAGQDVLRIEGGYKAMRAELLAVLATPPPLFLLCGMTGSGKTNLLRELNRRECLDIEALAQHRGSSFGRMRDKSQPAQATFENALALGLWQQTKPVLLEDESKVIGSLHLPETLFLAMQASPLIELESSVAERVQTIRKEYVEEPLRAGVSVATLAEQLATSLRILHKRLGGALHSQLQSFLSEAWTSSHPEAHDLWIEGLLTHYYDPTYAHSSARPTKPRAFRGNYEECRQWIQGQYA